MSPLLRRRVRVLGCHCLFYKTECARTCVCLCVLVCLGGARCLECVHSSIFYYWVSGSERGGGRWSLTQLSLGYKPDKSPVYRRAHIEEQPFSAQTCGQFGVPNSPSRACFWTEEVRVGGENPKADRENRQTAKSRDFS